MEPSDVRQHTYLNYSSPREKKFIPVYLFDQRFLYMNKCY